MTEASLKDKTAKGLLWGGLSNGIQQLLNLFFGIFLARLLTPADYGMVGMLTIFSALASILQEGGFISALTNRKKTEHKDYNAVFWFSLLMGISLYTLLYIAAPFIADFYGQPLLTDLARLSFLSFLISSTNVAPRAFSLQASENQGKCHHFLFVIVHFWNCRYRTSSQRVCLLGHCHTKYSLHTIDDDIQLLFLRMASFLENRFYPCQGNDWI